MVRVVWRAKGAARESSWRIAGWVGPCRETWNVVGDITAEEEHVGPLRQVLTQVLRRARGRGRELLLETSHPPEGAHLLL